MQRIATMPEARNRSPIVGVAVLGGLGVVIFLLGAVLGYCQGAFGDGGTAERGFDWAVKTGLLLVAMSVVLGVFGGLVLSKVRLPAFVGWAFVMGLAFAIMNGGGILLAMNDKAFWPETIKGLLFGAIVGAIAGPIIHRNQMRRLQKEQLDGKTSTDQQTTEIG